MERDTVNVNEVLNRINRLFEQDRSNKTTAIPFKGAVRDEKTSPLRSRKVSPPYR